MAEIKSTLERVMERVALLDKAAPGELEADEKTKEGMKIGAAFLNGSLADIDLALAGQPERDQGFLRRGLVQVLLRNIVLPRQDDGSIMAEKAMQGLLEVGRQAGDLAAIFKDMQQILQHYVQHKKQLREQLEAALSQQLEQAVVRQTGRAVKMDAARHPKYQEEWLRIKGELDEEYGRAIEQHKLLISKRIG